MEQDERIRVALADDHRLVRAGLRSLLEKIPGVEIAGEASDGREAIELIKNTRPNIAILDVAMPGLNGIDAIRRSKLESPSTRVLILSGYTSEEFVVEALRAGAAGYLVKEAAPAELDMALQALSRGNVYLSPAISKHVVALVHETMVPREAPPLGDLTPRQREILQLIAEGKNTKEIACILNISTKTVEGHRVQLMDRLGIHDIPGLVRLAIRTGLVSAEK